MNREQSYGFNCAVLRARKRRAEANSLIRSRIAGAGRKMQNIFANEGETTARRRGVDYVAGDSFLPLRCNRNCYVFKASSLKKRVIRISGVTRMNTRS